MLWLARQRHLVSCVRRCTYCPGRLFGYDFTIHGLRTEGREGMEMGMLVLEHIHCGLL